jgi:hypothetical protein
MSLDYDRASYQKPITATAAGIVLDGTTLTDAIDTNTLGAKALTFFASVADPIAYDDLAWVFKESDDGVTYTDVDSELVVDHRPSDGTQTASVFHAGCLAKKRYVKGSLDTDGTTLAAVTKAAGSAQTLTSLTSSSTTATATKAGHGLVVGQYVTIAGANESAYNGTFRVATVADSSHFTYTMGGAASASPATGTVTATPLTTWATDPGADIPATVTAGADAQDGTYHVTVSDITSASAVARVTKGTGNTGNGTIAVASISAANANAVFNETLVATCTAAASDAGTFTVRRADGTSLGTVTVGGGATNVQVGGVTAFTLAIADGSSDWIVGDVIEITITDLGVNRYTLTAPDGTVVGHPLGGVAFSSTHLSFTVPDTTVAVSATTADLSIEVTHGLATGQILVVADHLLSNPVFVGL